MKDNNSIFFLPRRSRDDKREKEYTGTIDMEKVRKRWAVEEAREKKLLEDDLYPYDEIGAEK